MKDREALNLFVQNVYTAENIPLGTAIANLENSLFEFVHYRSVHAANGIFVTDNGYFLSSNHCFDDPSVVRHLSVRGHTGYVGSKLQIFERNPEEDIAFGRVKMEEPCTPRQYKIFNTQNFKQADVGLFPIVLKSRWDGKIKNKFGYLKLANSSCLVCSNQLESDLKQVKGDSGGILVSPYGRLMGLHSGGHGEGIAEHSKIHSGLELISEYANSIRKKSFTFF